MEIFLLFFSLKYYSREFQNLHQLGRLQKEEEIMSLKHCIVMNYLDIYLFIYYFPKKKHKMNIFTEIKWKNLTKKEKEKRVSQMFY